MWEALAAHDETSIWHDIAEPDISQLWLKALEEHHIDRTGATAMSTFMSFTKEATWVILEGMTSHPNLVKDLHKESQSVSQMNQN